MSEQHSTVTEIWRPIPGLRAGLETYEASDIGRVRRKSRPSPNKRRPQMLPPRMMKQRLDYHGRPVVSIGQRPRFVHSLVLLAFVGERPTGLHCCHNDGNPRNNAIGNLRYDTVKANMNDKRRHGTNPDGEKHGGHKLTERQVLEIHARCRDNEVYAELAKEYGVCQETINQIALGESWKYLGLPKIRRGHWAYNPKYKYKRSAA